MLEPYETKVSRTVLRRGRASNRSFLFGVTLPTIGVLVHPLRFLNQNNDRGAKTGARIKHQICRMSKKKEKELVHIILQLILEPLENYITI
jgi:hypothetical protein